MANYVFVSYSREDKYYTQKLASQLRRRGFGVWVGGRTGSAEEWREAMVEAVRTSGAVVVVATPAAAESEWVAAEVELAQREGKPILALLLDVEGLPFLEVAQPFELPFRRMPKPDFYRELQELAPAEEEQAAEERQPFEPEMVLIPAGKFLMGSDPERDTLASEGEQPQHTLYLPDFYLSRTLVTNAQYLAFVKSARYEPPAYWSQGRMPRGTDQHPVIGVTWDDALAYCRWLAETTGRSYTLPSEAEWEKGARGTDGRIYPWGDAWEVGRCNSREDGVNESTPVSAYPQGASPYGLLDMAGNVWQWTRNLWGTAWDKPEFGYPYDAADGRENLSPDKEMLRVIRGGSFLNPAPILRCAARYWYAAAARGDNYGFRVAISPAHDVEG
jgi:formylglycine-generating enzyme required for sulfatase activity